MDVLKFLLLLAAFICFLIAAFTAPRWPRINFIGLGLACWVLVPLIGAIPSN